MPITKPAPREGRGCSDLVFAPLLKDETGAIEYGEVEALAWCKSITEGQEQTTEKTWADNAPVLNKYSGIAFTRTFSCLLPEEKVKARLEGQYIETDSTLTGVSSTAKPLECACGYKVYDTDGTVFYRWLFKGTFTFGQEVYVTMDDGTESNGIEITFNALQTVHKFTKTNSSETGIKIAENDTKYDTSTFFDQVTHFDNLTEKSV